MSFITRARLRRSWLGAAASEPAEGVLKQIVRDLNRLQDEGVSRGDILEVIQNHVPDDILCLPGAGILRQQLPADVRIKVYLRAQPRAASLTDETARIAARASAEWAERFWLEAGKQIEYEGFLWNLAPASLQNRIVQNRE